MLGMATSLLLQADSDLAFECIDAAEAEFLYYEIFVREAYAEGGLEWPQRPGALIVDVGANIGLFSLYCARRCEHADILAIEPLPPNHDVLCRNVVGYSDRVFTEQCALGRAGAASPDAFTFFPTLPGESTRRPAEKAAQHALLYGHDAPNDISSAPLVFMCPVLTLSDVLLKHGFTAPIDLLKVDVEGDELDVLQGIDANLWPRIRQMVVEVEDRERRRLPAVLALLSQHGFDDIRTIHQRSHTMDDYVVNVPDDLRLFHVFALRATWT